MKSRLLQTYISTIAALRVNGDKDNLSSGERVAILTQIIPELNPTGAFDGPFTTRFACCQVTFVN